MERVIKLLSSIFIIWFLGLCYFIYDAHKLRPFYPNLTDAVIVVGNDPQELAAGIRMVKFAYAPIMFLNYYERAELDQLIIKSGIAKEQVIIAGQIRNYSNNYIHNVVLFLKEKDIDTIRIVGDAVKIRRFVQEFEHVNQTISYIEYPIVIKDQSYFVVLHEYNKYLLTIFALFVGYDGLNLSYT